MAEDNIELNINVTGASQLQQFGKALEAVSGFAKQNASALDNAAKSANELKSAKVALTQAAGNLKQAQADLAGKTTSLREAQIGAIATSNQLKQAQIALLGDTALLRQKQTEAAESANQLKQKQTELVGASVALRTAQVQSAEATTNLRNQSIQLNESLNPLKSQKAQLAIESKKLSNELKQQKLAQSQAADSATLFGTALSTVKGLVSGASSVISGVGGVLGNFTSGIGSATKGLVSFGASALEVGGHALGSLVSGAINATKSLVELGLKGAEATGKLAIGFGKESVSAFKDFEKEISAAGAVSGLAGNELLKFREDATKTALDLGKDLPVSASQAAKAITELTKAGLPARAALGAAGQTALLAAAGSLEMSEAATITANTMSQFGLATTDYNDAMASSKRATDVLAKTANASSVDVKDLAKTFEYAGPVAAGAGFAFEDVAQAAGALGNAGIKGSAAGTGLNMVMSQLASPTGKAADALTKLGHSTKDSAGNIIPLSAQLTGLREKFKGLSESEKIDFAKQIVGVNHFPKLLALMTQSQDKWDAMADATHNASDAAKEMSDAMTDNLYGKLEMVNGTLDTFKIKIGAALAPAVKIGAEALNKLLIAAFPLADVLGVQVTKGIDLVKQALSTAEPYLNSFKLGLSGNWKPEGIHSVGAVFATAGNMISETWQTVKGVIAGFKAGFSGEWIPQELHTLPALFARIGDTVHTSLVIAGEAVKNFFAGLSGGSAAIETSSEFGKITIAAGKLGAAITEKVIPTAKKLWQEFKPVIQTAFDLYTALSPIGTVLDVITGTLTGGFNGAWEALTNHVAKAGDVFGVNLRPAMEGVGTFLSGTLFPTLQRLGVIFTTEIVPKITEFATVLGTNLSPILTTVGNLFTTAIIPSLTTIGESVGRDILPRFFEFANIVGTNLQPVISGLVNFANTSLIPTLGKIGEFIGNTVIPFFGKVAETINTVAKPAFEGLSNFITNTALPIFKDISDFIGNNVVPALTKIGQFVNENVMPALKPLAEFLGNGLKLAFEGLGQVVNFVWGGIKEVITTTWNTVSGIFSIIEGVLGGDFGKAWDTLKTNVGAAWDGISTGISTAWDTITTTFNTITTVIGGTFSQAWEDLKTNVGKAWDGIGEAIGTAWDTITSTFDTIKDVLGGSLKEAWENLETSVSTVWDGVVSAVNSAWDTIKGVFDDFTRELGKIASAADKALKGDFVGAWDDLTGASKESGATITASIVSAADGFTQAISPLPKTTATTMGEVKSAVTNTNLKGAGQEIGAALGDGMAAGMGSKLATVMNAAANLAKSASNAAKANLQIASPSKVFMRIGEQTADGLTIGIQSGAGDAESAVVTLTGKITDEALQAAGKQAEIFGKIAETSKKIFDTLSSLRNYSSIGYKHINAFATDIHQLVSDFAEVQRHFEVKTLASTANFADATSKVADMTGKGVNALNALRDYGAVGYANINAFATNIHQLVADFVQVQSNFSVKNLDAAAHFAESAGKVVDLVGKGVSAMAALNIYVPVASSTFKEFGNGIYWLISEFTQITKQFDLESVANAAKFAESAGKVLDLVKKGVDGFAALGNYAPVAQDALTQFARDINSTMELFVEVTGWFEANAVQEAGKFADAAGKVVGVISNGAKAFNELATYKGVPSGNLQAFVSDIELTVKLAGEAAKNMETDMLKQIGVFGEATGKLFTGLKSAMDVFKGLLEFKSTPSEVIEQFVQEVGYTVGLAAGLAEQTDKDLLAKTSAFGEATSKIFSGLKSAMDTFKSLTDFKGYPAEGMQNLLNGIVDAVGKMAEANDTASALESKAQDFYNKMASASDKLKDAANKAREGAQAAADATNAFNSIPSGGSSDTGGGGDSIPAYAVGTSYHPGGFALFGETPELLKFPDGKYKLATTPTLANLPTGTEVYSGGATQAMMTNTRSDLPPANIINFGRPGGAGDYGSNSDGRNGTSISSAPVTIQQSFTVGNNVDAATLQRIKQAGYEGAKAAIEEQGARVNLNRGFLAKK